MEALFTFALHFTVFIVGASIGSFLNVVVYRVPAGLSILWPPSRCPQCLHQLGHRENIPVLGWLWLKGRCRHCHSPISMRYPLVEAATGLLFLLAFGIFGVSIQTLGYWILLSWLLALSLIDLDTLELPNALTQPGLVVGLGFQVAQGISQTPSLGGGIRSLMAGIIGAVIGIWLFDLISLAGALWLGQPAMGGGDAKLAALMGAWLGWKYLLLASFLACGLGAFLGGALIGLGVLKRRQPMPFGPFLALGTAIAALWGSPLLSAYFKLFFPLW